MMEFSETRKSLELADKLNVNFTKEHLITLTVALLKETFNDHDDSLKFLDNQVKRINS